MLYIFDLDSTLVELYGTKPLPRVQTRLESLRDEGHLLAVATNQAGPAWGVATGDDKFPEAAALGHRFRYIAELIPALEPVPWFVAVHDERLSLPQEAYGILVRDLEISAKPLDLRASADPAWRKPRPGMLLAACRHYDLAVDQAVFVGDAETDEEAAEAAGIAFVPEDEFFDRGAFTAQSDRTVS